MWWMNNEFVQIEVNFKLMDSLTQTTLKLQ
jgi:hypothetical protein